MIINETNIKKIFIITVIGLIDFEFITLYFISFSKKQEIINDYLMIIDDENHEDVRNPIVAIMGHVDHGKTTLLDTICQTNVQEKERGGITQKITVSQIIFEKKKIIFLDTPGHEDFIYIRSHIALLAYIIIFVISESDVLMKKTL